MNNQNVFGIFTGEVNPENLSFSELHSLCMHVCTYDGATQKKLRRLILNDMSRKASEFREMVMCAQLSGGDVSALLDRAFKKAESTVDFIELFRIHNAPQDRKTPNILHWNVVQVLFDRGKGLLENSKNASPGVLDGFFEFFFCALKARSCTSFEFGKAVKISNESLRLLGSEYSYTSFGKVFSVNSLEDVNMLDMVRCNQEQVEVVLELMRSPETKQLCIEMGKEILKQAGESKAA